MKFCIAIFALKRATFSAFRPLEIENKNQFVQYYTYACNHVGLYVALEAVGLRKECRRRSLLYFCMIVACDRLSVMSVWKGWPCQQDPLVSQGIIFLLPFC